MLLDSRSRCRLCRFYSKVCIYGTVHTCYQSIQDSGGGEKESGPSGNLLLSIFTSEVSMTTIVLCTSYTFGLMITRAIAVKNNIRSVCGAVIGMQTDGISYRQNLLQTRWRTGITINGPWMGTYHLMRFEMGGPRITTRVMWPSRSGILAQLRAIIFCNAFCNMASTLKFDVGLCTHF